MTAMAGALHDVHADMTQEARQKTEGSDGAGLRAPIRDVEPGRRGVARMKCAYGVA
jgi:hypothetical protein